MFPPLAGNTHVTEGNGDYIANTILHGRTGKLEVNGKAYSSTMPAIGMLQNLSNAEVAAIATYIRSTWGNKAEKVTQNQVRQQR